MVPPAVMFRRSELPPWCRWLLVHTLLSCVRGGALLWHSMLHLRAFAVLTLTAGMELKSLSSACHDGGGGTLTQCVVRQEFTHALLKGTG